MRICVCVLACTLVTTFYLHLFTVYRRLAMRDARTYREGDVVVLGKEDDSPILGQISKIYYFYQEDRCHSPSSRIFLTLSLL